MFQIRVGEIGILQLGKPKIGTFQIPVRKIRSCKMCTIGVGTAEKEVICKIVCIPAVPLREIHQLRTAAEQRILILIKPGATWWHNSGRPRFVLLCAGTV